MSLDHFTSGTSGRTHLLLGSVLPAGLWQGGSTLYAASEVGVRAVPLPVADDWNGATSPVVSGAFNAIAGSGDDNAFAVGDGGVIAHFDGTAWTRVASGTESDLVDVAVRDETDAWAIGLDVIVHWDGTSWSVVPAEPSMPAGGTSLAVFDDGTLAVASYPDLHLRAPAPVAAGPTATNDDFPPCDEEAPLMGDEWTATNQNTGCMERESYAIASPSASAVFVGGTLTATGLDDVAVSYDDQDSSTSTSAGASVEFGYLLGARALDFLTILQSGEAIPSYSLDSLEVNLTPLVDATEPNDTSDTATMLTTGAAVAALLPTRAARAYLAQSNQGDPAFYDMVDVYRITRPAGPFSVQVSNVPASAQVRIMASAGENGSDDLGTIDGAVGSSVTLTGSRATAGDIYIRVEDVAARPTSFAQSTPPSYLVQSYTIVVP